MVGTRSRDPWDRVEIQEITDCTNSSYCMSNTPYVCIY